MSIDMRQFYQVFFEESEEHLAAMETLLLGLDIGQPDPEQLNAIFRAAHSIKGSSGTFGFTDLAEVTHILETLLDRLRKHEIVLRADMVDAFLAAGDALRTMLAAHRGDGRAEPGVVAAVCARLRQLATDGDAPGGAAAAGTPEPASAPSSESGAPPAAASSEYDIEFLPSGPAAADPSIVAALLEELGEAGTLRVIARPPEGQPAGHWHLRLRTDVPPERFGESIDFIAERGAWRIAVADTGPAGGGERETFGFFDAAPGVPADEGFGLFDDAPGNPHAAAGDEACSGFDPSLVPDPVLPARPAAAVEGTDFGFFEPPPEASASAPSLPVEAAPVEQGEGYGFFVPLPPVPCEPAPAASLAVPVPVAASVPAVETEPARTSRRRAAASPDSASIRVGVEKVDLLINLVGELVITQAMLLQCAEGMAGEAPARLLQGLAQLERNTRDLQESVMSIRMLPISFVFSRFPRVVHDLSAKLGKQVELRMLGETTELDKGLIERIADPLTHLIRNSLDHGIEAPEVRAAAGKNPVGTITLRAAHQGGNVVIEVGDDGAGLNRRRILDKARERGLPVSEQMSDAEVWALIFEAGFSTAERVTDVSGRGVGMDVVRKNIQALGGRVDIESLAGAGTRMTVRLPLTLAILDGMSVAVGNQTYILPLSSVIESLQVDEHDVRTLSNQARVIRIRGEYLPLIVLHELFGIAPAATRFAHGIMVVLDADGTRAALFVDALVGQHQVVIKSLEGNYRRVPGISGATIMGDGRVALILDVAALAAMAKTARSAA